MTLSTLYWLALGFGMGMLGLSVLLGDLLDFLSLDIDIGGSDVSFIPVLLAALAAFGAGGLFGLALGLAAVGSIVTGIGTGVAAGFLVGVLFWLLHRQQGTAPFDLSHLIGMRARASLPIGPDTVGRVTIAHQGMTRALTATSGERITPGEEVIVKEVVGNTLTVVKPETLGLTD